MKIIKFKHDELFRVALSHPKAAREFLGTHLPEAVKSVLELNYIKVEKDGFIDETLKEEISDVLISISTKSGEDALIYCLVEYQSEPQHFMAFRMMKYMFLISDMYLTKNPGSKFLPLIYPMLFYTGKKPYNVATKLSDLYQNNHLVEEIFIKGYQLINLDKIPDDIITSKTWLGMLEIFMKHIKIKKPIELWKSVLDFLPEILKEENGLNYVTNFIAYSLTKMEKVDIIYLKGLLNGLIQE